MLDTSASFLVLTPRLTLWMLSCAHQKYDAVFVQYRNDRSGGGCYTDCMHYMLALLSRSESERRESASCE